MIRKIKPSDCLSSNFLGIGPQFGFSPVSAGDLIVSGEDAYLVERLQELRRINVEIKVWGDQCKKAKEIVNTNRQIVLDANNLRDKAEKQRRELLENL